MTTQASTSVLQPRLAGHSGIVPATAISEAQRPAYPVDGFSLATLTWVVGGAPLAGRGRRFLANLIDGLGMTITLWIGWILLSMVFWAKGQTPGKALMGIRCVDPRTGEAAGWGQMAVREFVCKGLLNLITFGLLTLVSAIMILDSRRQALWDKMTGKVVVDARPGRTAAVRDWRP